MAAPLDDTRLCAKRHLSMRFCSKLLGWSDRKVETGAYAYRDRSVFSAYFAARQRFPCDGRNVDRLLSPFALAGDGRRRQTGRRHRPETASESGRLSLHRADRHHADRHLRGRFRWRHARHAARRSVATGRSSGALRHPDRHLRRCARHHLSGAGGGGANSETHRAQQAGNDRLPGCAGAGPTLQTDAAAGFAARPLQRRAVASVRRARRQRPRRHRR
ncbi:MAG: hypothetical protein KatS3mg048_3655 [Caldilinea sp.]|nr:MAG: hypothetical protein KatS3mg048_3655 [Caldilinea sp.]